MIPAYVPAIIMLTVLIVGIVIFYVSVLSD